MLFQSTLPIQGATWDVMTFGAGSARFQSTVPIQGATSILRIPSKSLPFQSTLPIQGATANESVDNLFYCISIHAPHTGSDSAFDVPNKSSSKFQSTLPIQGAT